RPAVRCRGKVRWAGADRGRAVTQKREAAQTTVPVDLARWVAVAQAARQVRAAPARLWAVRTNKCSQQESASYRGLLVWRENRHEQYFRKCLSHSIDSRFASRDGARDDQCSSGGYRGTAVRYPSGDRRDGRGRNGKARCRQGVIRGRQDVCRANGL